MPNPRKTVDFTGIQYHADTYLGDGVTIVYDATQPYGCAAAGRWVSMAATDLTVKLAADGDSLVGRIELVEPDGMVVVQTGGYALAPAGTGAAVTRGAKIVGALLVAAAGYVRAIPAPAGAYAQAEAAAAANGRHQIIANGTTTALLIKLDGPSGAA